METKTLFENKWLSLKERDNYVFSHETRCNGNIVAVLPFRMERTSIASTSNNRPAEIPNFLLRWENNPAWGNTKSLTCITGGVDAGNSIMQTALHELEEEAGYKITEHDLIDLGTCKGAKSTDTLFHLFTVSLTGFTQGEAKGDGSEGEKDAYCEWMPKRKIYDAVDPLVYVMYLRMQKMIKI